MNMNPIHNVLLTGGAGYIGSTCIPALGAAGYVPFVLDNLANGSAVAVSRASTLADCSVPLFAVDVRDQFGVERILKECRIDAVVHFAGLKSVSDSVAHPLDYYDSNVRGTVSLLKAMSSVGVRRMVFSSSATVYSPDCPPYTEDSPLAPSNPYGGTKLVIENILRDLAQSDSRWRIAILRYFNPVGAHSSGIIGEDPRGTPNNLVPFIARVAVGRLEALTIHGNDFPTRDGTGERDFVHVMDLADGHVSALAALPQLRCQAINLGTGRAQSVLEVVRAFERASGRSIPVVVGPRRHGDVAVSYAVANLAQDLLGWRAKRNLDEMCEDAWRWQNLNPYGYDDV